MVSSLKLFNASRKFFISGSDFNNSVLTLENLNINVNSEIILEFKRDSNGIDSTSSLIFRAKSIERLKGTPLELDPIEEPIERSFLKLKARTNDGKYDLKGHRIFVCANVSVIIDWW